MALRRYAGLILFVLALSASGAIACDLQPEDQNPAAVPGIEFEPVAALVNENFRNGPKSERYYDHVAALDGITLGFGHWPQQEVEGLFKDLSSYKGGAAYADFVDCMVEFFSSGANAAAWRLAQRAAGVKPAEPSRVHVAAVLGATLFSHDFMKTYGKHCNEKCRPGEPDMFHEHERWLVPALRYGLRDREVIAWQVDFWTRTIVDRANDLAEKVGMRDDAAVVIAAAAYRSSAPAWFGPLPKAATSGQLSFNGLTWHWNVPPTGAKHDAETLRRWRLLVLWQYYAARVWHRQESKHRQPHFRTRSINFYNDYLADYWLLPALDKKGMPNWKSGKNLDPDRVKPKARSAL